MVAVRIPFGMHSLIEPFRGYLRSTHSAPSTIERYVRELEHFIAFLAEDTGCRTVTLEAVDSARITAFLMQFANSDGEPSRSAWNVRRAALSSFYDWLVACRERADNPASAIAYNKLQPGRRLPLSLREFVAVSASIEEHAPPVYRNRNLAIVDAFLYTGMRVSSLVSLNVAQLDFLNLQIHEVTVKRGKTMTFPMNDQLRVSLERCLEDRPRFHPKEDEPAVFLSDRGTRLDDRTVRDMVTTYARKAGILRRVSPHVARHGSGTQINRISGDPRLAQLHLGHESLETTQIYLHPDDDAWRTAIQELGLVVERQRAALKGGREPAVAAG